MSRYVVDSSVAIKWFIPEVHSPAALRLLASGTELLAPDLVWPESANVLWKRQRRGEMTAAESAQVLAALRKVPIRVFPSLPLVEDALRIANAQDRTVYDSLYLALAVSGKCPLVTADEKLFNALNRGPLGANMCWIEQVT